MIILTKITDDNLVDDIYAAFKLEEDTLLQAVNWKSILMSKMVYQTEKIIQFIEDNGKDTSKWVKDQTSNE